MKLDTYNRVSRLQSFTARRLLMAAYAALATAVILALTGAAAGRQAWAYALLAAGISLAACLLISNYDGHRPRRCRYCGSPLDEVVRPLLLTPKYLAMEGRKHGDFFYTRRHRQPWGEAYWVRLSNRSLVCHHCRLMEEAYREVEERPSADDIRQLTAE